MGEVVERMPSGLYKIRFPGEAETTYHEVPACAGQRWTPKTWLPIDITDPQRMHIVATGSSQRKMRSIPTLAWYVDGGSNTRACAVSGPGPSGITMSWDESWTTIAPVVASGYQDSVLATRGNLIVTQYDSDLSQWRVRAIKLLNGDQAWIATNRTLLNGATNGTSTVGWDNVHNDVFCITAGVEAWHEHHTEYQYRSFAMDAAGARYFAIGTPIGSSPATSVRVTCRAIADNTEVWTHTFTDRVLPAYGTVHGMGSALILLDSGHVLFQSNFPQSESKIMNMTRYPAEPVDPYTIEQYTASNTGSTQEARVTSLSASDGSTEWDVAAVIESDSDMLPEEAPTQATPYEGPALVYGTGSTFYTFEPLGGYCTSGSTSWVSYDWGFSEYVPNSTHIASTAVDPWMLIDGKLYAVLTRTCATHFQQRIDGSGQLTSSGDGANVGRSQHLVSIKPDDGSVTDSMVLWGESDMPPLPAPNGHYPFEGTDLRGRLFCGSANKIAMSRRDGAAGTVTLYASDLASSVIASLPARYSDDQMLLVNGAGVTYAILCSPIAGLGHDNEFIIYRFGDSITEAELEAPITGGASTTTGSTLITGDGRLYLVAGTDRKLVRIV